MDAPFISGITSGIVVTLLVVVFRAFWERILVPWFEERVYKDAKIEGTRFSLYPTTRGHRQETIVLKRHGHTISGNITCTGGLDKGESYSVAGSIRNMILPLIYEINDREKTDRGTITLKLVHNAERFEGKVAAYNTPRDSIANIDVVWFRSKDKLEVFMQKIVRRRAEMEEIEWKQREAEEAREELTQVAAMGKVVTVEAPSSSEPDINEQT